MNCSFSQDRKYQLEKDMGGQQLHMCVLVQGSDTMASRDSQLRTARADAYIGVRARIFSTEGMHILYPRTKKHYFNSAQTSCIVKTSGFTRGVCKNR